MFTTVLIANRGEIACRAIRTLKRLGVTSVAVYSDADRNAPHVAEADRAVALGGDKAADSYLRIDKILAAAAATGAQAIYPGYGFLSESAEFADACEAAGIAFIGPTAAQMREFGLKHRARELAALAGVPMTPGTGLLESVEQAVSAAARIGYPVMLKSTAGGGGIGLTRCDDEAALRDAYDSVKRLGEQFFRDAGAAEFNLHTVWVSIPHFFDYLAETVPTLHWHLMFADGRTEGSLAYWGYRLNIQLPLIWETLQLALAATIFSVLVATVLAFLAAGNTYTPASVRLAIRTLVAFLRTMPELAWAVMFVMAFGIGAIPGFLALALHTIGSLTKLFYESIETASNKPVRGLAACGATPLQRMRFGLWPQVKPVFLSYSFMRLEINFRQSTILGLVGAGGIGQELMTNIKLDRYDQVSMTLLLIIVVVSVLDYVSGELRKRVVEGAK